MFVNWESHTNRVNIIDQIRAAIGREVYFMIPTYSGCPEPTCSLDIVTNTSTDAFCNTCNGEYWIPIYDEVTISGHVFWKRADEETWVTGGKYPDGVCTVQIKYTTENLSGVESADYIRVDDRLMKIKSKVFRGVPQINRIILTLDEVEE